MEWISARRGARYDTSRCDIGQGEKAGRHNIGKCMLLAREIDISGGEIGLESRVTLSEKQKQEAYLSARLDSILERNWVFRSSSGAEADDLEGKM